MFTTADTTNYPTYAGRTDNWARLEVTTSARDSGEVMQKVIYSTDGVEFTRLNANGTTWTPWQIVVSDAATARKNLGAMEANPNTIELGTQLTTAFSNGGIIDFHYQGSTANYTSRIMEIRRRCVECVRS